MKKITILIPAYNEEANLRPLLIELEKFCTKKYNIVIEEKGKFDVVSSVKWNFNPLDFDWEFLFVNDGSKDNTLELLYELQEKDSRINVVNLSRNFGKENAMLAGMDYSTGDAVIIMDADLQHPVSAIPEMIYWWMQGYDDVYARRESRGKEPWLRKKMSLWFYSLLQSSTRIEILQNVGDFRLLDIRVVRAICSLRETQRYTKGLYCWVGFKKKEILFKQSDRAFGDSKWKPMGLLNLAIDGITCFTTAPLRIATVIGCLVAFLSLFYLLFVFIKTIFWGDNVQGFPTLMCVMLFIGGIQLIALGIIGEYIGRIFNETKMRPPYIIESYNNTKKYNNKDRKL